MPVIEISWAGGAYLIKQGLTKTLKVGGPIVGALMLADENRDAIGDLFSSAQQVRWRNIFARRESTQGAAAIIALAGHGLSVEVPAMHLRDP